MAIVSTKLLSTGKLRPSDFSFRWVWEESEGSEGGREGRGRREGRKRGERERERGREEGREVEYRCIVFTMCDALTIGVQRGL